MRRKSWSLGLASCVMVGYALASRQDFLLAMPSNIVPDRTLGNESSIVTPLAPNSVRDEIEGGAIRGANLFHSFHEFNVSAGREVYFKSPSANIENILTRVTGSNRTEILGTLGTFGNSQPNLFLINPNGIIFGQNAFLDVGGSFVATTASSVRFANGISYSATNPQAPPLLMINVPIGLQFGVAAAGIHNQSVAPNSSGTPVGLQVLPGKTLALVGGDITLPGGRLTAEGGRIELGSVSPGSLVSLAPTAFGWALGYAGVPTFKDIQLSGQASVNASGEGGGDIQVQGRSVTITSGSQLGAATEGALPGRTVSVTASELVEISGADTVLAAGTTGDGNGGDISINTPKLIVRDRALLGAGTSAAGNAGDITINAQKLIVQSGGTLVAATFGTGFGGNVSVTATDSVELSGAASGFVVGTIGELSTNNGNGGKVRIETENLIVRIREGAQILPGTIGGTGNGGEVRIETENLIVRDRAQILAGAIGGTGNGGRVTMIAGKLDVLGDAEVSVANLGSGNAGNLEVAARSIQVDDRGSLTATSVSGNGGNIRLQSPSLILLRHGSNISAFATGSGNEGNITIDTDLLVALENSDIIANNDFAGNGANINIRSQGIFFSRDSQVTASGTINIEGRTDVNLSATLPEAPLQKENLIVQGCAARENNKFTITGRGGLPPNPTETLSGDTVLANFIPTTVLGTGNKPPLQTSPPPTLNAQLALVEARGWVVNEKGQVVLTAQPPTVTPTNSWQQPAGCQRSG